MLRTSLSSKARPIVRFAIDRLRWELNKVVFSAVRRRINNPREDLVSGRRLHVITREPRTLVMSTLHIGVDAAEDIVWFVFTYPWHTHLENRIIRLGPNQKPREEDLMGLRRVMPSLSKRVVDAPIAKIAFWRISRFIYSSIPSAYKQASLP